MYSFGGKEFKYQTFFKSFARTVPPVDKSKEKLAIASLSSLTGIFDSDVLEKIRSNPDLLAFSSCLVLADYANKNDDAVLREDLIRISENFEYKFIDLEHNRQDCLGVIDETGWALFPSNELIEEEELAKNTDSIQLVIGGYLWRVINPDLCNLVESASNENSDDYQKVSTSFELLFNDYWVCVSPDRNAKNPNARLIAPEDEDFVKYDKKLKVNGGDGKEGGMLIFRVLRDGILPVGAGIVRNPASGIKGIAVVGPDSELKVDDDKPEMETEAKEILINISENGVNENKSTNTIMAFTSLTDIEAQFDAFVKLPVKEATASIQKIMESKILELSTDYAAKEKAKDEALATELKAKADLEERATGLGKAVEALQKQLDEITAKQTAAANEAAFNSRMAVLDDTFDLDDDDRAILVDEVKALESEAAFMPWMDKKKKLMKEKTKAYKAEKAKCMTDKMAKAGFKVTLDEKTLDVKEVFASLKDDNTNVNIPNGAPAITEDLAEKMKKLRAGITVAGVKTE